MSRSKNRLGSDTDMITVDSLKESTGVTDDQLDKECSKAHLKLLAPHIGNYTKFSSALGLPTGKESDIKTNQYWDFQQKTEEVLLWWCKNASNATYRSFVQTCISLSEGGIARELCDLCAEGIGLSARSNLPHSAYNYNCNVVSILFNFSTESNVNPKANGTTPGKYILYRCIVSYVCIATYIVQL